MSGMMEGLAACFAVTHNRNLPSLLLRHVSQTVLFSAISGWWTRLLLLVRVSFRLYSR